MPLLGKGGSYRSFGKTLDIPGGWFADFADGSRLAMMQSRRTLDELRRLQRDAVAPEQIGRMIALVENEHGFPLYDAVSRLKRALSDDDRGEFRFSGGGVEIAVEVRRSAIEEWIAKDLRRLDAALAKAGMNPAGIDKVFLTGGSSLIPAIRAVFDRRFGTERIATGGKLTSIAYRLALIGAERDPAEWGT